MTASCLRSYIGIFERYDCLKSKIIKKNCNKYKESVSLENTSHLEAYVVQTDSNNIMVIYNF